MQITCITTRPAHLFALGERLAAELITVPTTLGDVNLDGAVNFLDISPFIGVLSGGTFQAEADCDQNGVVSFLDISPFIASLPVIN